MLVSKRTQSSFVLAFGLLPEMLCVTGGGAAACALGHRVRDDTCCVVGGRARQCRSHSLSLPVFVSKRTQCSGVLAFVLLPEMLRVIGGGAAACAPGHCVRGDAWCVRGIAPHALRPDARVQASTKLGCAGLCFASGDAMHHWGRSGGLCARASCA